MNDILKQIIEKKRVDLAEQKKKVPEEVIKKKAFGKQFYSTFTASIMHPKFGDIALIAEIKLASPTVSSLGSEKEVLKRAKLYEEAEADAISFITEKHYFKGDISFIPGIKKTVTLPVLQKDFVIDAYQIYEAKMTGSDALLLIARIVDTKKLHDFVCLCQELEIEPVVEIQTEEDLEKIIASSPSVIAVNARDLETFSVDVPRACELLKKIPDGYMKLGFSGIHSFKEVKQYREAGVEGVLVGTSLMKAGNIEEFLRSLRTE